jgi:outer membrane protein assembly factor BamB
MTAERPLRLWPAIVIVALQVAAMIVTPLVFGETLSSMVLLAGVPGGALIYLWWLFASRAPWAERLGVVPVIVAIALAINVALHPTIAGAGRGMLGYIFAAAFLAWGLVAWAVVTRQSTATGRRLAFIPIAVLACVPLMLLRTPGVRGSGPEFHWRWTPSAEERLLARGEDPVVAPPPTAVSAGADFSPPVAVAPRAAEETTEAPKASASAREREPEASASARERSGEPRRDSAEAASGREGEPKAVWPGFRGPARDGVVRGVRINTDWNATPPVEMWRRPVGPGWSSFSVRGDYFYTQEQRGEEEIVACYQLSTGNPVWRHRDPVRFWESNGGAGPRATPTIHGDRVYSFGATGVLNALDARTGTRAWSRDVAKDTGRSVPEWGFASSPLVVGDVVIVAAAGTLAGYDVATGEPRWKGPSYGGSYSSPHHVTIDGVEQVMLLGGPGAISVDPKSGTLLWKYEWQPGPIVQPAVTDEGDIIVNGIVATGGLGTRRLHVTRNGDAWTIEERWASNGLKPYFNDFVLHKGHAFGFDGNIMSAINLQDGKRDWKGGRYGNGQVVLLADQDMLLVVSEEGELVLVQATPDQHKEVARFQALEGKTWNHPVLVGNVLLVRNGEQMAAFRMPAVATGDSLP